MNTPPKIKVLGSDCSKCRGTMGVIERAASDAGIEMDLAQIENPEEIRKHGVHATPAVVMATRWFTAAASRRARTCRPGSGWPPSAACTGRRAGALARAAQARTLPAGEGFAWAAGEATEIAGLRHVLVGPLGLHKARVRASAYWKLGRDDHHEALDA